MYETVLVPTDGSPETEQATRHALGLALAYGAAVHALYVVDTRGHAALPEGERESVVGAAEKQGRAANEAVVEEAGSLDLDAHGEVRRGVPHAVIRSYAEEVGADVVAMGTHGWRGRRPVLGSTTDRVVRSIDRPVLTVRFREGVALDGEPSGHEFYERVLVPTDGSDEAEAAAEHAVDLASTFGAELHAVYVVDTGTYAYEDIPRSIVGLLKAGGAEATEAVADVAHEAGVPVETAVVRGVPFEEILDYARNEGVDLIAMGAHGETSEVHLGSTTAKLVSTSEFPVLTVR